MQYPFVKSAGLAFPLIAILISIAAHATDGNVDMTFGAESLSSGIALAGITNGVPGGPRPGPVVQPDGKILIAGTVDNGAATGFDMFVARFTPNGILDTTFSFDGRALISFADSTGSDQCAALALQTDGKILIGGYTQASGARQQFAVARFNADGSLDTDPTTGFGSGTGKVTLSFPGFSNSYVNSIVVQSNGKIVLAGATLLISMIPNNLNFGIMRLNADGMLDTSFNSTGRQIVVFDNPVSGGTNADIGNAVAIDSQSRIVIAGTAEGVSGDTDFAIARLLSNGTLDTSFNSTGRQIVSFNLGSGSNADSAETLTIQRDDKIVLAGTANTGSTSDSFDMALARLQPDGALDTGFGAGGKTTIPFNLGGGNGSDIATGVVAQGNGKLLIAGYASTVGATSVLLAAARLDRNGSLDSTFSTNPIYFGALAPHYNPGIGIALQGNQIIVGGVISLGSQYDFFVTRLNNDLLFADQFE